MKVFKCDGKRYTDGVNCGLETTSTDNNGFPEGWITIRGKIVNNNDGRHMNIGNGEFHFCSPTCLQLALFKNLSKLEQQ